MDSDFAPPPQPTGPDAADPAQGGWPARPLLYAFQHVALPQAAFENHPELLRELEDGPSSLPLLHFRSRARLRCEVAGWPVADDLDDAAMDAEDELFSAVRIQPHRRAGHTVHLVAMPAPRASPEAHFVAIVHADGEPHEYPLESPSTRYVTLEMTGPGEPPALCEWTSGGTHLHLGSGPEPDAQAFVDAVFDLVARDRA